ncbi:MAG: alpha-galactosidase [Kiritimatiellae bacterium]|jgi:alpha-galactosidase|nr:alpha-galactosidase [Kiritimatiellia bacterium]
MKKKRVFSVLILVLTTLCLSGCRTESDGRDYAVSSENGKRFADDLQQSGWSVEDLQGGLISSDLISVERKWRGNRCVTTVKNIGKETVRPASVILFNMTQHGLPPESPVYGEGFAMLYQNGGTLGERVDIGNNPDSKHYKIPEVHGLPTAYGVFTVNLAENENLLLGFTSCERFIGRISFDATQLLISVDTEGIALEPGESWTLPEFVLLGGENQGDLFNHLADMINENHPPRIVTPVATGWCSWYCYRMNVTDQIIRDNMKIFKKKLPELKFIQLDDGYQPFFGDWLDPNPDYGNIKQTLADIRAEGFEPAIWVAPFIAQKDSRVLREHPDWFVKNEQGTPLDSSSVSFGGWRYGPWYALDGTHPEVQKHFENVFRVMREEWGVNYFKLDANYWGALQGGQHYLPNATRIEAYRQGMQAVLRGCDEETILLGCNAPIWPSFGLVTSMRTSGDIRRRWRSFKSLARQNMSRGWQNGKLWHSDPDCIVLTTDSPWNVKGNVTENEWIFHATSIHAVGGFILSGDKAELLHEKELGILKKLLEPTGQGARFTNAKLQTGVTDLGNVQYYYFFNWSDTETIDLSITLTARSKLTDYWTDEALGMHEGAYTVKRLPPRSARLIRGVSVK